MCVCVWVCSMNLAKYDTELVPGPLVFALTLAASARGFFETLYEHVPSSVLTNKVEPNDTIGAISYVHKVQELTPGLGTCEPLTVHCSCFALLCFALRCVALLCRLHSQMLTRTCYACSARPQRS